MITFSFNKNYNIINILINENKQVQCMLFAIYFICNYIFFMISKFKNYKQKLSFIEKTICFKNTTKLVYIKQIYSK